MSWSLLKWFRRDRRDQRDQRDGRDQHDQRDGRDQHDRRDQAAAPVAAPVVENRMGDETMLFTTGLRLPDMTGPVELPDPSAAAMAAVLPGTPPGSALLVVHHGPQAGARFLLSQEVTGAGRSPKQDILLDDVTVSRAHAEFVRCGDGFMVRDLNSLNGTYVGAERVAEAVLRAGDVIRIGKFRLVYHPGPRPGTVPAAQGEGGELPAASGRHTAAP